MLGINYIKFDPMDYVIHYRNGRIKKQGKGLSFFYFDRNSSIISVPLNTKDISFVFNEMTKDYQNVTVQGQVTYLITEPSKITEQLDFTVNRNKMHVSDDYDKLTQRLVNEAQTSVSAFVHSCTITDVLSKQVEVEARLLDGLKQSKVVVNLGIEIIGVSVLGISADPEMRRALEAKTREALHQDADKAIYDRRNFAVEQERKIKESELNTEIAVEEKQKQIVEKKMETDLAQHDNDSRLKELEMESLLQLEEMNKSSCENENREPERGIRCERVST